MFMTSLSNIVFLVDAFLASLELDPLLLFILFVFYFYSSLAKKQIQRSGKFRPLFLLFQYSGEQGVPNIVKLAVTSRLLRTLDDTMI